jgi:copper resistance protein D
MFFERCDGDSEGRARHPSRADVILLAICRFAHFMATMLAFGASAYLLLYASGELRRSLAPSVWRLVTAASAIALVSAILWLQLEAASMADDWSAATDPRAITAVVTDTAFGAAWIGRLVLAAMLVAAVFWRRRNWATIGVLSGLLLASLALVGHAAMQASAVGVLHRLNHAAHLLTAGAWLGGLIPFVMCLTGYCDQKLQRDAVNAMMRFSYFARFVVAGMVATGIVNIALTSGRAPLPPSTPYRALLVWKIAIVAVMISLAAFNRYWLTPRLGRSTHALGALRLTSVTEIVLGALVVALVSLFAQLDPA